MSRLVIVVLFFLFTSSRLLSQANCNIQLQLDTGVTINSKLPFSRFSIAGVNKKVANQMAKFKTIGINEDIFIHPDTICKKFHSMLMYRSFVLTRVEVYEICTGTEPGGLFRLIYSRQ